MNVRFGGTPKPTLGTSVLPGFYSSRPIFFGLRATKSAQSWSMFTYSDSRPVTPQQQSDLMRLIYSAFLDIRAAGLNGDAKHAAAIAEAFHNLPMHFADDRPLSVSRLRGDFTHLQKIHPPANEGFDYVKQLDALGLTE